MHDLRTIAVPKRTSKYRGLRIEAPGCIVNIIKDVFDAINDRKITVVEIILDQYVGEEWCLADFGESKRLHVRVAEGKPVSLDFTVEPDDARGAQKTITIGYRGRVWRLEFRSNAGLGYYAVLIAQEPATTLFLGEFRVQDKGFWPGLYEEHIAKAKEAIKNVYKLVEGG